MKKTLFYLITASTLITVGGCKKKLPSACFTASKTEAETNTTIDFTSCSENAVKYEWIFGDGATGEGETASHQYTKKGSYLVNLKVYTKKNKAIDRASSIVTITDPPVAPPAPAPKKRFLTKLVLTAFSQTNGGSNWDGFPDNVNPDVYVNIKYADDSYQLLTTPKIDNLAQTDLPRTWNYAPNNLLLTDNDWLIEIIDHDDTSSDDLMKSFTSNLATVAATNGKIVLTDGTYTIEVYFEER